MISEEFEWSKYISRIQNGSDQSISSIGCDNRPIKVTASGFVTFTARFENVKWWERRTVRAISRGLNGCTIILHAQNGSDELISITCCDNAPTEVIPTGFTTYTAQFESTMVQKEHGKSDFGSVEWLCILFTYIEKPRPNHIKCRLQRVDDRSDKNWICHVHCTVR